jgi:hypothetical protein
LERPHQLFLTGDQIYADEVADVLLVALTDAGDTLLGWKEELPGDVNPTNNGPFGPAAPRSTRTDSESARFPAADV